jgi:hypothetical protein
VRQFTVWRPTEDGRLLWLPVDRPCCRSPHHRRAQFTLHESGANVL